MSRSGAELELIRIGEQEHRFEDVVWRVADTTSVVLLRFAERFIPIPSRGYPGRWTRNDERVPTGNWWCWSPLGTRADMIENRRCGSFILRFAQPVGLTVRVVLFSERIFAPEAFAEMVQDIETAFPYGVWDDPDRSPARSGTRPMPRIAPDPRPVTSLLGSIAEELAAARRIVGRPLWELVPAAPGRPHLPGALACARSFDVPENRVAASWVRLRLRHLRDCSTRVTEALAALQDHGAAILDARGSVPVEAWRTAHRTNTARLCALLARLADQEQTLRGLQRRCDALHVPPRWTMTPAIRRRADPGRLAAAHYAVDHPWAELSELRQALLPLRTTPFLFEIWAALELVRAIEATEFVQVGPPEIHAMTTHAAIPGLPTRATWTFARGDLTLRLMLGPTARRFPGRPAHGHAWAHLSLPSVDVAGMYASLHGHRRVLIGIGDSIEPDYVLLLTRGDQDAFCVGDALCCDASYAKAPESVRDKLIRVRRTYARRLAWIDADGRLVPCIGSACFVIIPRPVDVDLEEHPEEQEVLLMATSPGPDPQREASRERMRVVLDTLEWHLDHRPPLTLSAAE